MHSVKRVANLSYLFLISILLAAFSPPAWSACSDDLGSCGGDGQRICIDSIFTAEVEPLCCDGAQQTDVGVSCAIPRELGERCSAFFPCNEKNLKCTLMPWEPALRCTQKNIVDNGKPFDEQLCKSIYSKDVHNFVGTLPHNVVTFGGGLEGSGKTPGGGSVEGLVEIGTAYAKDGRFGCYRSICAGVGLSSPADMPSVSGALYAAIGGYPSSDDFNFKPNSSLGDLSFLTTTSTTISAPIPGTTAKADISISLGQVSTLTNLFAGNTLSLGVGASSTGGTPFDVSLGEITCYTAVVQVKGKWKRGPVYLGYNNSFEQWVNVGEATETRPYTVADFSNFPAIDTYEDGEYNRWFEEFEPAFESIVKATGLEADDRTDKQLWVEGNPKLTRNINILNAGIGAKTEVTLNAMTKTCAKSPSVQCGMNSDCPGFGICKNSFARCSTLSSCENGNQCIQQFTCNNGSACATDSDCTAGNVYGGRCNQPAEICNGITISSQGITAGGFTIEFHE